MIIIISIMVIENNKEEDYSENLKKLRKGYITHKELDIDRESFIAYEGYFSELAKEYHDLEKKEHVFISKRDEKSLNRMKWILKVLNNRDIRYYLDEEYGKNNYTIEEDKIVVMNSRNGIYTALLNNGEYNKKIILKDGIKTDSAMIKDINYIDKTDYILLDGKIEIKNFNKDDYNDDTNIRIISAL